MHCCRIMNIIHSHYTMHSMHVHSIVHYITSHSVLTHTHTQVSCIFHISIVGPAGTNSYSKHRNAPTLITVILAARRTHCCGTPHWIEVLAGCDVVRAVCDLIYWRHTMNLMLRMYECLCLCAVGFCFRSNGSLGPNHNDYVAVVPWRYRETEREFVVVVFVLLLHLADTFIGHI